MLTYILQIESNFKKELESVNITVESLTFNLNEGAMKSVIKFFVSDLLFRNLKNFG